MDPSHRLEFRTLQDQHPLRIEAAVGSSRTLVVSMTSVGTSRHEWPPKEFVKLASQEGQNHVLCVTDISRSWMNGAGLAERISDAISDYILEQGITELVGLGTSMGGYNLLVLGQIIPFARIIALVPQYSVHPDIMPDEKRWRFFRKQITNWPYAKLDVLPKPPCDLVMIHGDTDDEQMHWRKMPAPENLHHFIFPNSDHNVAQRLRETGDLNRIIRPALQGRFARMTGALSTLGAVSRATFERLDT